MLFLIFIDDWNECHDKHLNSVRGSAGPEAFMKTCEINFMNCVKQTNYGHVCMTLQWIQRCRA